MEEYKLTDWHRLLIGEAPTIFLLEIIVRSLLIFLALQLTIRAMGKRMAGQLTISEMAVMITLGAIVAAPIQLPDRGIITGIVILCCALIFQRQINLLGFKSKKIEEIFQGRETLLVKDGILQLKNIKESRISQQQIYAALRNRKIYNLAAVKRLYLEACGLMSLFENKEATFGLPITPPIDQILHIPKSTHNDRMLACTGCGSVVEVNTELQRECENCRTNKWTKAVKIL